MQAKPTTMQTSILRPRIQIIALMLAWFLWMVGAGSMTAGLEFKLASERSQFADWTALLVMTIVSLGLFVVIYSLLPRLSYLARWWMTRVVDVMAFSGAAGLGCGAAFNLAPEIVVWPISLALLMAALCTVSWERSTPERFFLFDRSHVSNGLARRSLIAAGCQMLFVAVMVGLAIEEFPAPGLIALLWWRLGVAYLVGIVLSLCQPFPQRAVGLIPFAAVAAALALIIALLMPGAGWPIVVVAVALGLAHTPARNDLLANLPQRQRPVGLALMIAARTIGAFIAIALIWSIPSPRLLTTLVAVGLAVAAVWFYLRELIELVVEPFLALAYPVRGYGPGVKAIPMRGPVLVIANHTAWLDPLWVAKLMPLRMRPLMTARFFDLPCISWLMRKVFHTIRVPDATFRRETPEIQQAIAALDRGENVLIFPEGWLKRKEEQSVRRFGQGVYQILREKPRTPVVACWIEGGWGSYMSFYNGPPTKNKKMDFFRLIRIGISEPQVLSLSVLSDQIHTRRHLMHACLHARTFLGLPELPPPPFGTDGDGEDE